MKTVIVPWREVDDGIVHTVRVGILEQSSCVTLSIVGIVAFENISSRVGRIV